MADKKDGSVISSKCSVCGMKFSNLQECLKHELISHSLQKKSGPKGRLQKRINATAKFLNSDEKKLERQRLSQQLKNCRNGEELKTIFGLFCMKTDNLGLIFTRIQTCLEKELQSAGVAKIYPFGSIASGLALRDCDIDIYLDVSSMNAATAYYKRQMQIKKNRSYLVQSFNCINNLLHRSKHFTDVFAIRKARVPIIKCQHKDTGFNIDINISYPSSRENTQFVHDLVKSDERIHELMLFMKLWAKNTQIIGRVVMTSYCLITMVIFFLQQPLQLVDKKRKGRNNTRILKSVKELQVNCPFHMVQGVNYAYDLTSEENKPQIPTSVTTWDLIKEFFEFYENFNFEDYVISPFYGKSIAKTNIAPDICEEYYKQLKTITQYLQGEPANNLKIDCCMCVQDAFCLNQNTAKNIAPQNKQYIVLCLQNAKKIFENSQNLTLAELYAQLLFDTTININSAEKKENTSIKKDLTAIFNHTKAASVVADTVINNNGNLSHIITPSKADLRTIATHYPEIVEGDEILQCWCQHYTRAICIILTNFYRMDMGKQMPTKQKQQKLDQEPNENLNSSWAISCTIDLWSNRCFQKNLQTTFMQYQLEQTERLHSLRRQDPKYSVTLNAILKLNILPDKKGMKIKFELPEDAAAESLRKKSPVRKFFNVFKNTLQNFCLEEILDVAKANAETNKTVKTTDTVIAPVSADSS